MFICAIDGLNFWLLGDHNRRFGITVLDVHNLSRGAWLNA